MRPTQRYLIALLPERSIAEQVIAYRERLHALIGDFSGRSVPPHLTLCLADLALEEQESIAEVLAEAIEGQAAFNLHYTGITHFPDRRTIYVDPAEKDHIGALRDAVVSAIGSCPGIADGWKVTEHPHLTIAAGLKTGCFEPAWSSLAPYRFAVQETVSHVALLRRSLVPGASYGLIAEFPLLGKG